MEMKKKEWDNKRERRTNNETRKLIIQIIYQIEF